MSTTMADLNDKFTESDGFVYLRIKTEDSFWVFYHFDMYLASLLQ